MQGSWKLSVTGLLMNRWKNCSLYQFVTSLKQLLLHVQDSHINTMISFLLKCQCAHSTAGYYNVYVFACVLHTL